MNQSRIETLKELIDSGAYTIDANTGDVFSRYKGSLKKSSPDGGGYLQVNLSLKGKSYMYKVHELVAYVNGLDLLDKTINHIDGDKTNNSPDNLEAITREENISHRHMLVRHGRYANTITRKRIKAIECCYKNGFTENDLSEIFDTPLETINNLVDTLLSREASLVYEDILNSTRDEMESLIKSAISSKIRVIVNEAI